MQEILKNLALIDLTRFCKDKGLNMDDSHIVKSGRGFTYTLVRTDGMGYKPVAAVTFKKNSIPTHMVYTTN